MSAEPTQDRTSGEGGTEIVSALMRRLRLRPLGRHRHSRLIVGALALVNGFVSIALMSLLAFASRQPFIFPSLGPTAFLLFARPLMPASSPRNTFAGHLIGVVSGYLSLAIFGLLNAGPALVTGVTLERVAAAGLSLGLTAGLMLWLDIEHAPAGATTLIVSLGILAKPEQLLVLMLGVVILLAQAFVINRVAGLDYPVWSPFTPSSPPSSARSRDRG